MFWETGMLVTALSADAFAAGLAYGAEDIRLPAVSLLTASAVSSLILAVSLLTGGLAGGILGLMLTAQGWGYAFPYALLCLGMRANNPQMELDAAPFLLSAAVYTALFSFLTVRHLRRHDIAAE